jgi:hypothetical protein
MAAESEVVTCNVLKDAGVKVPGAWLPLTSMVSWSERGELDFRRYELISVEMCYFFMERMEGSPFDDTPLTSGIMDQAKVQSFIEDYASFAITLSNTTYSSMGSLTRSTTDGKLAVGPLVPSKYFSQPDHPFFFGPFKKNRERYKAHCDFALDHIGLDGFADEDPENDLLDDSLGEGVGNDL